MGRSSTAILLSAAAILLIAATTATAINISKLLEDSPEYSEFNSLLTKTKLANEINSRNTVTVLALENSKIGDIISKPEDVQKRILSAHVVLDYLDTPKLQQIKESKLTTLFQASGNAKDQQGFLNVVRKNGVVFFGSSVIGAPQDAKVEDGVVSQPYSISILRISHAIVIPGIDAPLTPNAPNAAAKAPAAATVPPSAAAETPKVAAAPVAKVPATTAASAPTNTASSAPAAAAASGPAAAPKAAEPAADSNASPPPSSGAVVNGVSFGLIVGLVSLLAA